MSWKLWILGVVCAAVLLGTGLAFLDGDRVLAQEQRLYVVTAGGNLGDNQQRAFFTAFEKATGTKVIVEKLAPPEAFLKLKAMVENKSVQWDVVALEARQVFRGVAEGLYEPIDYSTVKKSELIKEATLEYAVGVDFYTNQLGYSKKAFPNNSQPKTMAEFWDIKRFPQRRVLRNQPYPNLEHAMQVVKGSPNGLYPLDIDAAFKKLDEIKPAVKVWYVSGAQPGQLLVDGEVDLAFGNGARFFDLIRKGAPIGVEWIGSIDQDYWVVPKGTARKSLAMKFIAFASQPAPQADYVKGIPVGPVSPGAFKLIDAEYGKLLPTYPEHYSRLAKPDYEWWGKNERELEARWNAWVLKK